MPFRLLAITEPVQDPSRRYRLGVYLPYLRSAGIDVHTCTWPVPEAERRDVVDSARWFDAVLIQRRLVPCRHARALRANAKRLAYDFDDVVIRRDSAGRRPWILLDRLWQFRVLASSCDALTPGNAHLARIASVYASRSRIQLVPTVLDAAVYEPRTSAVRDNSAPVLGWIGQYSTLAYLEQLREPLQILSRRIPSLRVRCISDKPAEIRGVNVEWRRWSEASESAELSALDIGIAPLPDDAWTRGKCALRLLQYLAAGVPAVASPVGTQARIVDCGGALPARTGAEWAVAIERLLKDTELRAQLAGIGRALVEKRYAPSAWFAKALAAWCGIQCTSGGLTSLGAKQKRTQSGTKEYRISNKEFPDS